MKTQDYVVAVSTAVETIDIQVRRRGDNNWKPDDYDRAKSELIRMMAMFDKRSDFVRDRLN